MHIFHWTTILDPFPIVLYLISFNILAKMLNLKEIQVWWERMTDNYLRHHTQTNQLSIIESMEKNFTRVHNKLIELFPIKINKYIDQPPSATKII